MPYGVSGRAAAGQHKSTGNDWLSPRDLVAYLGPFSLDPCASYRQPWRTAKTQWTEYDDGFNRAWSKFGLAWVNPPYGAELYHWLARLAEHGNGLALLYARTDTAGFHAHVWARADAVFFFAGRLWFHEPVTGFPAAQNCGGPMVLAVYGPQAMERAKRLTRPESPYPGHLVTVRGHAPPRAKAGKVRQVPRG
jgi:hypothetical protein